ncbi:MAG: alanine racemase [Desulfococcaceae bacterium]
MMREAFYAEVSRDRLAALVAQTERPTYYFFSEMIRERIRRLRDCLGDRFHLHYAVKANPHPDILRLMATEGLGADVASAGEMRAANRAGIPFEAMEFSGPGKTEAELRAAVQAGVGTVNAESLDEIRLLDRIARETGKTVFVGIRINPELPVETGGIRMAGATQFGIDAAEMDDALAEIRKAGERLRFSGIHVHAGSQVLDSTHVVDTLEAVLELAQQAESEGKMPCRKINFGGGWGVPYFPGQEPLDLELIAEELADLLDDSGYRQLVSRCRLILEPGRFLTAEAGVFAARVLYRKRVRGREVAVLDGGMHQNYLIVGGMGQVIRRNFEMDAIPNPAAPPPEPMSLELDVAGPLCTPQDLLAERFAVYHQVRPGDSIVFFNCGAYGATASPVDFLSHPRPEQILVEPARA